MPQNIFARADAAAHRGPEAPPIAVQFRASLDCDDYFVVVVSKRFSGEIVQVLGSAKNVVAGKTTRTTTSTATPI